jgi:hypothetical protein
VDKSVEVNSKIIELQELILDLQKQLQDVGEQLQADRRWERRKKQFQLHRLYEGITVYTHKPTPKSSHIKDLYYCPNCFAQKVESIIQRSARQSPIWTCPQCKFQLNLEPPASDKIKQIKLPPSHHANA